MAMHSATIDLTIAVMEATNDLTRVVMEAIDLTIVVMGATNDLTRVEVGATIDLTIVVLGAAHGLTRAELGATIDLTIVVLGATDDLTGVVVKKAPTNLMVAATVPRVWRNSRIRQVTNFVARSQALGPRTLDLERVRALGGALACRAWALLVVPVVLGAAP